MRDSKCSALTKIFSRFSYWRGSRTSLERRITRRVKPIMAFIGYAVHATYWPEILIYAARPLRAGDWLLAAHGCARPPGFPALRYAAAPARRVWHFRWQWRPGAQGAQQPLIVVAELLRRATDNVQHPHHRIARLQRHAEPGAQARFLDHVVKGTVSIFCRVVTNQDRQPRCHNASTQAHTGRKRVLVTASETVPLWAWMTNVSLSPGAVPAGWHRPVRAHAPVPRSAPALVRRPPGQ